MKKIILICMLSVIGIAQEWNYLIYVTGVEYKNKKMLYFSVINENGQKVGVGKKSTANEANAEMLTKYFGKYNYKEAYEMDVLSLLGQKGWELITVKGEINNSNQKYYFKRKN